MELALENNYYAFSAQEEMIALVTVISGELDYSAQTGGPFRRAGSIGEGDTREFKQPMILAAYERTVFDIEYPPPSPSPAVPALEQNAEGSGTP